MRNSKSWIKKQKRIENRIERQMARQERIEERRAQREQRIADRQAEHDHDHNHHHPEPPAPDQRLNPHAGIDSLVSNAGHWDASYFKDRVTDGVIDVRIDSAQMVNATQTYTRKVIEEIDEIIGTPIAFDRPGSTPDLIIKQVNDWSDYPSLAHYNDAGIQGLAFVHDGIPHSTFKPPFATYGKLSDSGKYLVGHEILHCFGLDHPQGTGANPAFNTHDTLMSYNMSGNSQITSLDAQALLSIWG